MKLLALDTSTDACSVAISFDGRVHSLVERQPRAHARLILPMVERIVVEHGLQLSDLDALAFACGPGSFTGLRIACGVVQGLALALDKPVLAVSTLAAMAQQVYQQHGHTQVLSALDARMGEVYWAQYGLEQDLMRVQGLDQLSAPEAVKSILHNLRDQSVGAGSGWQAYQEILMAGTGIKRVYPEVLPQAKYLLPLAIAAYHNGETLAAEQAQPVYLRNQVAETTAERLAKAEKTR